MPFVQCQGMDRRAKFVQYLFREEGAGWRACMRAARSSQHLPCFILPQIQSFNFFHREELNGWKRRDWMENRRETRSTATASTRQSLTAWLRPVTPSRVHRAGASSAAFHTQRLRSRSLITHSSAGRRRRQRITFPWTSVNKAPSGAAGTPPLQTSKPPSPDPAKGRRS
jgi:hypothetical protein